MLLDSGVVRLRAFAQLGLFLPHAVPGIIAALIWLYLYTPASARSSTCSPAPTSPSTSSACTPSCRPS
ncbi:hypothetical protein ACFQV4_28595 [Streptomyces thermocarboxydus]